MTYGAIEPAAPRVGVSARHVRVAILSAVATLALLCAVVVLRAHSERTSLVEEADGLELAAYLSGDQVAQFKKVRCPSRARCGATPVQSAPRTRFLWCCPEPRCAATDSPPPPFSRCAAPHRAGGP